MRKKILYIIIAVIGILLGMAGTFLLGRVSAKPNDNQSIASDESVAAQKKDVTD